jgi:hypothetical protein
VSAERATDPAPGPLEGEATRPAEAGLDPALRGTLAGLADVLIPAAEEMPSGGAVLIDRGGLQAVLRIRPDMEDELARILGEARSAEPAAEVERLRTDDPDGFGVLTTVVAGAYFLDRGVREALGYEGQRAVPIEPADPPDYARDGLLTSVIERGPIYRPTPD